MGEFRLDLTGCDIFLDGSLIIDKKISFIFGKNGTGKSTLASLFKQQSKEDYDFRCFQGFDGIVGEDRKLNAVILGEENNEIDKEIKILEKEISDKEKDISGIEKEVFQSEDNPNNLWKKVDKIGKAYKDQKEKIDTFCRNSARKIKNLNNPQIASPTYNIKNFKEEINKAKLLTEGQIEKHKSQINTDIKTADEIVYQSIDLNRLLIDTNFLLTKVVAEKEVISEFSGNVDKRQFAEKGLKLHEINDNCAFCGGVVSKERYKKLERYFSADDVQKFRFEIKTHITKLQNKITEIKDITLNTSSFYPEYAEKVNQISLGFEEKQSNVLSFLSMLEKQTDGKLKELFEKSDTLELAVPISFEDEIARYNELVVQNNKDSDLVTRKENSKNQLRYNEIKELLDDFKYDKETLSLDQLSLEYDTKKDILNEEHEKIKRLKIDIQNLRSRIVDLQAKTKNEKILAYEINKKLKLYVNFDLEYLVGAEGEGHYQVKCKNTGEYRDVTQLSSGEKNIIAFLYFIHKLNEVDNPKSELEKIIVFDDPMTSNDDTMQYLIIEELNKLIKQLGDQDKILIMTHNNHFYLNVKYNYKSYKNNIFLRLLSDGKNTTILRLTKSEEDFKTNYEALWQELEFLYIKAPSETMLLNPIRRIVETYTKFNSIDKNDMLSHVTGAAKLFNVNSHSIDDLEADLNGKNKKYIMKMMRECFVEENAINHFNKYWTIDLDSLAN